MAEVSLEELQRLAKLNWGVDYPEALRRATGMNMDPNGIARYLTGFDMNYQGPTGDDLYEILGETTARLGHHSGVPLLSDWTANVLTAEAGNTTDLVVNGGNLKTMAPTADVAHTSGMRYAFTRNGLTGADIEVTCRYEVPNWNINPGSGAIFPQGGVALRMTEDGVKRRIVAINNNIVYGLGHMNIGCWASNLDGTGFQNRQASFTALTNPLFPYNMKVRLVGNIVDVWYWGDNESFPPTSNVDRYKRVNLDTEAGTVVAGNETPVGVGAHGIIGAHIGSSPLSFCEYTEFTARIID